MSDENISLSSELRAQAVGEPSYVLHRHLLGIADLLDEAIGEFAEAPSWATLKLVNCLWARGWRHLERSRAAWDGDAA